jgi:carboxypeptidase family protein
VLRGVFMGLLTLLGFLGGSVSSAGQQGATIRVTVSTDGGAPVPQAEVRIVGNPALVGLPAPNGTFTFRDVAPGTYRISVTSRGFKDKVLSDVIVVEGQTIELKVRLEQAPPRASDFRTHEDLRNPDLYSEHLRDLGQPALCHEPIPDQAEWYRFLWVPTFDHPVLLRVDVDSDGIANLLTVVWSGEGGYEWAKPLKTHKKLTWDEQGDLFAAMADIGFWTLPSEVEGSPNVIVLDGTEWLIEGVKDGKCHVVIRYSTPLTRFFEEQFLANVAKVKPYYHQGH